MDYLHNSSVPATKSELDIFVVPPTQTAIDGYYDVEYRPTTPLQSSKVLDINIPASEDMTDLSATYIYAVLTIKGRDKKDLTQADQVSIVPGFANALWEQVDFFVNGTNIAQASNLYHHQAYIEDLLYKPVHPTDIGAAWDKADSLKTRAKGQFDLFSKLHIPLCNQNKLLIDNVPILLRLTKNGPSFGLQVPASAADTNYSLELQDLCVHMKRVKVYPDVSLGISSALEKAACRYFITRNEMKAFVLSSGSSTYNFEGVFSGILPKRMIVMFISNESLGGDIKTGPFKYEHFKLTQLSANVNGFPIPTVAYTPNFDKKLCIREFVSLYRFTNQDEGIPQSTITFDEYINGKTMFAFDLSPDGTLGGESGTLSLVKRGNIKLEMKFKEALTKVVHMLIFAQFDSLIEIDKARNVKLDY